MMYMQVLFKHQQENLEKLEFDCSTFTLDLHLYTGCINTHLNLLNAKSGFPCVTTMCFIVPDSTKEKILRGNLKSSVQRLAIPSLNMTNDQITQKTKRSNLVDHVHYLNNLSSENMLENIPIMTRLLCLNFTNGNGHQGMQNCKLVQLLLSSSSCELVIPLLNADNLHDHAFDLSLSSGLGSNIYPSLVLHFK